MTGGGATGTKAITKEIAYSAKLLVDEKVWAKMKKPMFSIEQITALTTKCVFPTPTSGGGSPSQPVDLFDLGGVDLQLVVEDNTASDNALSRGTFYGKYNPAILNVAVPLRLEVSKVIGPNKKPTEAVEDDEVEAVIELSDYPEDTSIIKGPKHLLNPSPKTGEGFIKKFAEELKKDQPTVADDNCIDQFAPKILRKKCRKLNGRINASKILYTSAKGKHTPLEADAPPNEHRARIKIKASKLSGHLEGVSNFSFVHR